MPEEGGGPDRARRNRRAILPGALTLLLLAGACGAPPAKGPAEAAQEEVEKPFISRQDLKLGLKEQARLFREYVRAMTLFESADPEDWRSAHDSLGKIRSFRVWPDDDVLLETAQREGPEGATARRQLAERGKLTRAEIVFSGPYQAREWRAAYDELMEMGRTGRMFMVDTLYTLLLSSQCRDRRPYYRMFLQESGETGLETGIALVRELAKAVPTGLVADVSGLEEVVAALINFGAPAKPILEEVIAHPNPHVRRGVIGGILISNDLTCVDRLGRLLLQDEAWDVRIAASKALWQMAAAHRKAGPLLLEAMGSEKDVMVLKHVVTALGECRTQDAVPVLVGALENPALEQRAMFSLWQITGVRLSRKDQWLQWYRISYRDWLERTRNPQ